MTDKPTSSAAELTEMERLRFEELMELGSAYSRAGGATHDERKALAMKLVLEERAALTGNDGQAQGEK